MMVVVWCAGGAIACYMYAKNILRMIHTVQLSVGVAQPSFLSPLPLGGEEGGSSGSEEEGAEDAASAAAAKLAARKKGRKGSFYSGLE